jgi:hypothetical protein
MKRKDNLSRIPHKLTMGQLHLVISLIITETVTSKVKE